MLLHEFGEDLVLALELGLEVGDVPVLEVGGGLAAAVGGGEGGGAVLEEDLVPGIKVGSGDAVFFTEIGEGTLSRKCSRSRATYCSAVKCRRCRVMNVPPREYCR